MMRKRKDFYLSGISVKHEKVLIILLVSIKFILNFEVINSEVINFEVINFEVILNLLELSH